MSKLYGKYCIKKVENEWNGKDFVPAEGKYFVLKSNASESQERVAVMCALETYARFKESHGDAELANDIRNEYGMNVKNAEWLGAVEELGALTDGAKAKRGFAFGAIRFIVTCASMPLAIPLFFVRVAWHVASVVAKVALGETETCGARRMVASV